MGELDLDAPLRCARPRSTLSPPSSSVPSDADSASLSSTSSADPLLQRRVVTVEEYADELRRDTKLASFRASVAPVPVVLAPSETEEQYEAKFISWLRTERSLTLADLRHDTNRERTLRISFASRVTREVESSCARSSLSDRDQKDKYVKDGRVDFVNLPRRLLLVHEYMSLEQFRRDSQRGRFAQIAQFSFKEKQQLFGSPYAPIYVPLAPGETKEQYEARFIEWLAAEHGMTLAQLENHQVHVHERFLRLQFAALNGKGQLRFEPTRKRDRSASDGPDESSLTPALKRAKQGCKGNDSVAACRACGCRQCLLAAMRQLAATITLLETKASALECPTSETSTTATAMAARPDCEREVEETDRVEQQLLEEYDSINEMIVMNESALDASAAEIVKLAQTDAAEATLRRDEDLELRVMIEEESERRRVALAMLVVYMYRHDIGELETIVDPTQTADVVHVQKLSHEMCARLAVEITETRARVVESESKSNEISAKLRRLLTQRRRELTTVVRFDQRVRELIRTLLTRAQCR